MATCKAAAGDPEGAFMPAEMPAVRGTLSRTARSKRWLAAGLTSRQFRRKKSTTTMGNSTPAKRKVHLKRQLSKES